MKKEIIMNPYIDLLKGLIEACEGSVELGMYPASLWHITDGSGEISRGMFKILLKDNYNPIAVMFLEKVLEIEEVIGADGLEIIFLDVFENYTHGEYTTNSEDE